MLHSNEQPVQTPVGSSSLSVDLDIVDGIQRAVLIAHGRGTGRDSPKNITLPKYWKGGNLGLFSFFLFCFSLLKLKSKFAITTAVAISKISEARFDYNQIMHSRIVVSTAY